MLPPNFYGIWERSQSEEFRKWRADNDFKLFEEFVQSPDFKALHTQLTKPL
jgi:hypothetical protein